MGSRTMWALGQDQAEWLIFPLLHLAQPVPSCSNGEQFTAVDILPQFTLSPVTVSTEGIRSFHCISAATKAKQYLQKCISILRPADMLWLLHPLNEKIMSGSAGISQHRRNKPKETMPIYLSEDLAQGIHNGWRCRVKERLEQLKMSAFIPQLHNLDSFCQMV